MFTRQTQKRRLFFLVKFVKASLLSFLQRNFKGIPGFAELYEKIRTQYEKVELQWPEKLDESYYKKTGDFPLPLLDLDKIPVTDIFWEKLVDTNLASFEEYNAAHLNPTTVGVFSTPESVVILPAYVYSFHTDPRALIRVLGHEFGHKMGWKVSLINGYDLRSYWKPVVDCLAGPKSIQLVRGQEDEALADWFSAYVVSDYFQTLEEPDRAENHGAHHSV